MGSPAGCDLFFYQEWTVITSLPLSRICRSLRSGLQPTHPRRPLINLEDSYARPRYTYSQLCSMFEERDRQVTAERREKLDSRVMQDSGKTKCFKFFLPKVPKWWQLSLMPFNLSIGTHVYARVWVCGHTLSAPEDTLPYLPFSFHLQVLHCNTPCMQRN